MWFHPAIKEHSYVHTMCHNLQSPSCYLLFDYTGISFYHVPYREKTLAVGLSEWVYPIPYTWVMGYDVT